MAIIGWCISLKGKSKREKTLKLAQILQELPNLILSAEKSGYTGISKQKMVLIDIQKLCLEKQIEYNEKEWIVEIERILETPQKKEVSNNGKEKQTNEKN